MSDGNEIPRKFHLIVCLKDIPGALYTLLTALESKNNRNNDIKNNTQGNNIKLNLSSVTIKLCKRFGRTEPIVLSTPLLYLKPRARFQAMVELVMETNSQDKKYEVIAIGELNACLNGEEILRSTTTLLELLSTDNSYIPKLSPNDNNIINRMMVMPNYINITELQPYIGSSDNNCSHMITCPLALRARRDIEEDNAQYIVKGIDYIKDFGCIGSSNTMLHIIGEAIERRNVQNLSKDKGNDKSLPNYVYALILRFYYVRNHKELKKYLNTLITGGNMNQKKNKTQNNNKDENQQANRQNKKKNYLAYYYGDYLIYLKNSKKDQKQTFSLFLKHKTAHSCEVIECPIVRAFKTEVKLI